MPPLVILADQIEKSFGTTHALSGVSIAVPEGEILGVLGPNGAGKTTLVRILSTLTKPDAGRAEVAGFDVLQHPHDVRSRIGLTGQYAALDEILTGRENLEMVGQLYRLSKADAKRRAGELLERFRLTDAATRIVKTYSGGMRRRLDLAASLIATPPVLFLDEPTTGLDPRSRLEMWALIEELVAGGTTLLLTTQYLEEADQLASDVVVIDHGSVIARGTPLELKQRLAGDVLDVTVEDGVLDRVVELVADVGSERPSVDRGTRRVSLPVDGGAGSLVEVVRRLDDAGVKVVDITLRRPSLDDVFLALTGHTTASDDDAESLQEVAR